MPKFSEYDYHEALTLASERAYVLFRTFGWTWAEPNPPTLNAIRECFWHLAARMDKKTRYVETGRLAVRQDEDGEKSFYVSVG